MFRSCEDYGSGCPVSNLSGCQSSIRLNHGTWLTSVVVHQYQSSPMKVVTGTCNGLKVAASICVWLHFSGVIWHVQQIPMSQK